MRATYNYCKLNHIAIAVKSIQDEVIFFQSLGYSCSELIYDSNQNVNVKFCRKKGYVDIELVESGNEESPVQNLIKKFGNILYHLCYEVNSIEEFCQKLTKNKVKYISISEAKEAVAFDYKKVKFIYINFIGLIELLEVGNDRDNSSKYLPFELLIISENISRATNIFRLFNYRINENQISTECEILTMKHSCNIKLIATGENKEYINKVNSGCNFYQLVFYNEDSNHLLNYAMLHQIEMVKEKRVFWLKTIPYCSFQCKISR